MLFGEVVLVVVDVWVFVEGCWQFDDDKFNMLYYLGVGMFVISGKCVMVG